MVTRSWSWPEFFSHISNYSRSSRMNNSVASLPNYSRYQKYESKLDSLRSRRVLNPAFKDISLDNPIVQHWIDDKVTDFQRMLLIGETWNVGTLPLLYGGPQMIIPKIGLTILGTAATTSFFGTLDQYRDIANVVITGEVHGHSIFGHSHY